MLKSDAVFPAERLEGLELEGGWSVDEKIVRPIFPAGSPFSSSYLVSRSDGTVGFLKAMDYHSAFQDSDAPRALEPLVGAYNFERDLYQICKDQKMSRIATVLGGGRVHVDGQNNILDAVEYLIFERGEYDVRQYMSLDHRVEMAWILRSTHQTAAALRQLHAAGIAHQDLRPSKIQLFGSASQKLADLGTASVRGVSSPADGERCAGDVSYAPPELLYGHISTDWATRRLGCDLYLLGSMLVFLITEQPTTHLLMSSISKNLRPHSWSGPYEEVLPYIETAFLEMLLGIQDGLEESIVEPVTGCIVRLCHPNPSRRGHPRNIASRSNSYGLERFISTLDRLARQAELTSRHGLGR